MSRADELREIKIVLTLIRKLATQKWVAADKAVESERRQKVLDDIVRHVERVLG